MIEECIIRKKPIESVSYLVNLSPLFVLLLIHLIFLGSDVCIFHLVRSREDNISDQLCLMWFFLLNFCISEIYTDFLVSPL